MNNCSSTIEHKSMPLDRSRLTNLYLLPQLHIFMCRARWVVTPHPSDAGSFNEETNHHDWMGPAKAILWMVISIGAGLLIANLGG